jgi:glycosyltransferase involved in cell wall biosynthesis
VRVPTSGFGRANLTWRAIDYITFCLSAAWVLFWRLHPGDVVVAKTDPPMLSVMVAPIAWLRGARLINWLQDIFPEVTHALNVGFTRGRWSQLSYRLLKALRDASLRCAYQNVVLGERMAERVEACRVPSTRIRIIPNWANGELIRRMEPKQNSLRHRWGLHRAFVIGYSGNLGRAHEIATLLDAIRRIEESNPALPFQHTVGSDIAPGWGSPADAGALRAARPEIWWLFIGSGALLEQLRTEVRQRGLTTVMFQPYQPRERLAESLSVADVHLISLRPELEGLIVPSKYYSVAAAGRPAIFIGDANGEIANILRRNDTGTVVAVGDGEGLASAVLDYAQDRWKASAHGTRARQLFDQRFDFPFALAAWEQVIDSVSASRIATGG